MFDILDKANTQFKKPKNDKRPIVLVCSRGEIAKRAFFVLDELGMYSIALVCDADIGQSWYDFANSVVFIRDTSHYYNHDIILWAIKFTQSQWIFPGNDYLSQDDVFVEKLGPVGFIGAQASILKAFNNKLLSKKKALLAKISVLKSSEELSIFEQAKIESKNFNYPFMLKLTAGEDGLGNILVETEDELEKSIYQLQKIGQSVYNNNLFYIEEYLDSCIHYEAQLFNGVLLDIRKCSVLRKNQKILTESVYNIIDIKIRELIDKYCKDILKDQDCTMMGAYSIDFLWDLKTSNLFFLRLCAKLQVDYCVTEESLGINLLKWQFLFFIKKSEFEKKFCIEKVLRKRRFHAIGVRAYAEDPSLEFTPSTGRILRCMLPTDRYIRNDFGFREGDIIVDDFQSLIGHIVAIGPSRKKTIIRLNQALKEFSIKGVKSNIPFVLKLISSKIFYNINYDNSIWSKIINTPITKLKLKNEKIACIAVVIDRFVEELKKSIDSVNKYTLHRENIWEEFPQVLENMFDVHSKNIKCKMKITMWDDQQYIVRINDNYDCTVEYFAHDVDYFRLRYKNKTYSFRVERKNKNYFVRLKNNQNNVLYYDISLAMIDHQEYLEDVVSVRCPFQAKFIKFINRNNQLKIGDFVEQDRPVVVIEAMNREYTINVPASGQIVSIMENGNQHKLRSKLIHEDQVILKILKRTEKRISI